MSDKLSAKSRMAEMYPVKMASGGIIGNIGRLQAAALGIQPQYKPGEEEYLKQYQDYQTKYNTEFMPQYEAFLPKQQEWVDQYNQYAAQQQAWVDSYNQAQKDLSSGKYDLRIKKDKVGPYFNQGYYTVSTSSNHQTLRPRNVEMVFKTPEPTFNIPEPTMSFQEPQAPALPKGFENPEQFQAALAERSKQAEARAKGVAVFADPGRYNLSGFAGSSTFNAPESKAFFAKGGDVKAPSKLDPVYIETESLRNQIEAGLPKDKYFETSPVSSVYLMENATEDEGGRTFPYKNKYSMEINPKGNFKDKYGTFEHERQHLLDAKRGKTEPRYPAPEALAENADYLMKFEPPIPVDKGLQAKTAEDISSVYQKYRKELGLSGDFTGSGFFAEIRRIEKSLPVGKSILETSIGKDLFANNPELLQTYWSRTRPEFTTYMTEQRDSPRYKMEKRTDVYKETPSKSKKGTIEKVQDFIRNKTAGYQKGGDVKKSAEPFGKGEPAKKVEGSPYNKDGAPITVQGPSAGDVASFINSFIPGTGDVQSAAEGYQAFKDKDYLGAALGAAGALPGVPSLAGHIKPKEMEKFFKEMVGSKIRNAEGELTPVYHAGAALEKGLPTKGTGIYSEGVYFSGLPSRTEYYGKKAKNGTTYPMYANIKNPISSSEFNKRFGTATPKNSKEIRDILVSEGYDGVISKVGDEVWEGVAFFPEKQLKSSISAITPKMKDEMLQEDVKDFNKFAHGGEVSKFIKSKN